MKSTISPKELALAVGASESSIKRWVDAGRIRAVRTAGGHRRIPQGEVVRFLREGRYDMPRPATLGLADVQAATDELGRADDEDTLVLDFTRALEAGRQLAVRGSLVSLYLKGWPVERIVDALIAPAMAQIGRRWIDHGDGILCEHRATDLLIQALSRLDEVVRDSSPPADARIRAVGGAVQGDPYIVPSLCARICLRAKGVLATNLGANTPIRVVAQAASSLDAHLVWLSATVVVDPRALVEELASFLDEASRDARMIVLGGRSAFDLTLPQHPNLHIGRGISDLAALAAAEISRARAS